MSFLLTRPTVGVSIDHQESNESIFVANLDARWETFRCPAGDQMRRQHDCGAYRVWLCPRVPTRQHGHVRSHQRVLEGYRERLWRAERSGSGAVVRLRTEGRTMVGKGGLTVETRKERGAE